MCSKVDISELSIDEQSQRAYDKILRMVNKREMSSAKMRMKLESAGFCEEAIASSLDKAIQLRYIDDKRYSECLIRTTLSMGKGLSQTEFEIKALGIELCELESYQQYLQDGEEAQIKNALRILGRHNTRSKDICASCFRKLISRGFSPQTASKAVRIHLDGIDVDQDA